MSTVSLTDTEVLNDAFVRDLLPQVEARSRLHYRHLDAEAREEAVQECLCLAWALYRSAGVRGKGKEVTGPMLAWFVNRAYDSGRRFAGSSHTDVMADGTRITGRVRLVAMEELDADGLREALTDRRADADPAENTRARLDWQAFAGSGLLNAKGAKAVELLALGFRNGELARALGVCDARATQIRQAIGRAVGTFFGKDAVPAGRPGPRDGNANG